MNFLRYNDDIINIERITRIYKEEVVCEAIPSGVVTIYKVVIAGDGQELKIKCDSAKEADKMIDNLWEIVKKCSRWYCF